MQFLFRWSIFDEPESYISAHSFPRCPPLIKILLLSSTFCCSIFNWELQIIKNGLAGGGITYNEIIRDTREMPAMALFSESPKKVVLAFILLLKQFAHIFKVLRFICFPLCSSTVRGGIGCAFPMRHRRE